VHVYVVHTYLSNNFRHLWIPLQRTIIFTTHERSKSASCLHHDKERTPLSKSIRPSSRDICTHEWVEMCRRSSSGAFTKTFDNLATAGKDASSLRSSFPRLPLGFCRRGWKPDIGSVSALTESISSGAHLPEIESVCGNRIE
jgi:hypothetical protein